MVACTGIFSKESNHLRLAMTFDYKNVTFADVDADGGAKVQATIVFPNDPKRRLEVWWSNPAERSGIYLIDIKGKSTWGAPGGMRLGLNLVQLEKLNKKPFKLKGFDKNGVATVSDWDGGALASLAGGCKSGVSLAADPKAPADAVSALSAGQGIQLVRSRHPRGQTGRERNPHRLLEHDPEKWIPVFGKDHAQPKSFLELTGTTLFGYGFGCAWPGGADVTGAAAGLAASAFMVRTSRAISRQVSSSV